MRRICACSGNIRLILVTLSLNDLAVTHINYIVAVAVIVELCTVIPAPVLCTATDVAGESGYVVAILLRNGSIAARSRISMIQYIVAA